ncbi:MAG: ABC transporter permease [Candidatus Microsaccharimonas sp.]
MKLSNVFSKRNRVLLRELVITDFKLRYQGSILGYFWSLLKPLFMFAVLYIVFGHFLRVGETVEHFSIYLLLGIVIWSFFTEATNQGLASIVNHGDLIRKINFPKYIIVVAGSLSALINFALNLIIIFVFMTINGVQLHPSALLFIPLVIELYVFAVSLAFFLSASYVKYRDVSHIWEVLLQGAFYATPILYPLSLVINEVGAGVAQFLMLNPVAQIIQDSREVLITTQTTTMYDLTTNIFVQLVPFVIVVGFGIFASFYFKKSSAYFSENV